MEVMIPPPPLDFNFNSTSTSPFLTPPSSPPHFSPFFSAPTSPSSSFRRLDAFSAVTSTIPFSWEEKPGTPKTKHRATDNFFDNSGVRTSSHAIPFSWEEKPGTPKTKPNTSNNFFYNPSIRAGLHAVENEADFEFDFSGHLDMRSSLSLSTADELFDGGVIKPLKPPPRLQQFSENNNAIADSPRSPRSPVRTNFFREALSPRHHHNHKKNKDFDPFEAAIEQARQEGHGTQQENDERRGRERNYDSSGCKGSCRAKGTRSLSPFRVCDIFAENCEESLRRSHQESSSGSSSSSSKNCSSAGWRGWYSKRWRLKDLLLFRSASEGRATAAGKDSLKKYSLLKQGGGAAEEVKSSSFRSAESAGSASRRRGSSGGPVSAHELHYTTNRAVSEEMRRKTFLPYNHGLLGCLGFNPAVHDISRGIGSVTRG